jgi:hypothetical protein
MLTISLDQCLRLFHLGKQITVSDHACCVPDFSTGLVETSDTPDNSSFRDVREVCDLVERLYVRMISGCGERGESEISHTMPFAHS